MKAQILCGYCGDELEKTDDLDAHLPTCRKRPVWVPKIGLEREGWDTPPDAA